MNHEQIYKDAITIVAGIASGLYASGKTEVDLSKYLNETYETVKSFRKKYEEETKNLNSADDQNSKNNGAKITVLGGRKPHH
ncbi:MAG: hypothetical protein NC131_00860 [Roseburia sp.]|nr:hypothetical protein [Roseburia sp.]